MKTASATSFPSENVVKQKPTVTAAEFGRLRMAFVTARIEQFAQRRNLTWSEADDIVNARGGHDEIDKVVDEHLHSSFCPDPSDYIFI